MTLTKLRTLMPVRGLSLVALFGVTLVASACGDLNATKAQYQNNNLAFSLHALSGSSLSYSSGLSFTSQAVTRVDGSFAFDIAFDISPTGKVIFYPVRLVGSNPGGDVAVGLLPATGAYENILEAPKTGYNKDSVTVVSVGQTVLSQTSATFCAGSFTPYSYAKTVIDSIRPSTREMFGRTTINQNCGFRSLVIGYPTF
jgi:hypothetical protein